MVVGCGVWARTTAMVGRVVWLRPVFVCRRWLMVVCVAMLCGATLLGAARQLGVGVVVYGCGVQLRGLAVVRRCVV